MARNDTSSAIIDGILEVAVTLGTISLSLIAPNLLKVLDKPTSRILDDMDEKARQREINRLMKYVLREKLITEHYQHGITLTKQGEKRLKKKEFNELVIAKPEQWDKSWRLVIFDIPEDKRSQRIMFTNKIKSLGFQHLQQSVWIHPFPCKDIVARSSEEYAVSKYITYIETSHIDNNIQLVDRFKNVLQ